IRDRNRLWRRSPRLLPRVHPMARRQLAARRPHSPTHRGDGRPWRDRPRLPRRLDSNAALIRRGAFEGMISVDPRDDYLHPVGPEANFNESMYFQFHDATHRIGGFLRLANRPNEGRGERTVCLYLSDGCVAFGFARPTFPSNERFHAGGLSINVVSPFE